MSYYVAILIAGFGGGAIRGLLGFIKHQYSYKNVGFDLKYFLAMTFISGTIGVIIASALNEVGPDHLAIPLTPAIALIAAYAGGDFLESFYKIILKK